MNTRLESNLFGLAKQHPRIFGRIADTYRKQEAVDTKTAREFQRLPDVALLILNASEEEVMLALATVCKQMIEREGERM